MVRLKRAFVRSPKMSSIFKDVTVIINDQNEIFCEVMYSVIAQTISINFPRNYKIIRKEDISNMLVAADVIHISTDDMNVKLRFGTFELQKDFLDVVFPER